MANVLPTLATLGVQLGSAGCVVDIAAAIKLSQCSNVRIKVEQQHTVAFEPDYICSTSLSSPFP